MDQYHCIDCGYEYNKSKVIDVIYSKIASIKGYVGGYSQGHQYFEINLLTGEVFYSKEFNGELDLIKRLNENQIDKLLKDLKAVNIDQKATGFYEIHKKNCPVYTSGFYL